MTVQKSEVAQVLRQISLKCDAAARGLMGFSTGSARQSSMTARLEQTGAYHERIACVTTKLSRYCKKRLSRVKYNIDVVKHTPKLQVRDAV
jgi:hypothetical protein